MKVYQLAAVYSNGVSVLHVETDLETDALFRKDTQKHAKTGVIPVAVVSETDLSVGHHLLFTTDLRGLIFNGFVDLAAGDDTE